MKNKYKIICFILLMIFNNIYSQCVIENDFADTTDVIEINYSEETHSYGQSFVADCDGNIEYFEISNSTQLASFDVQTIEIYNGTDINGTPIYTQTYNQGVTIFNSGESFRFVFDSEILLLADNIYTIVVATSRNSSFLISNTNNYDFGSAVIDGVFQTDKDLLFKVLLSDTTNNCNVGNEYIMADATIIGLGSSAAKYLQFLPVSLSNNGNLTGLGHTGLTSIGQLRLALYDDLNNSPNNLLAETGIEDFDYGIQTLPVTPTVLNSGNYWIAYAVNVPSGIPIWRVDSYEPIYDYYYLALDSFESDLPNQYTNGTMSINDTKYPLFIEISCHILNVEEFEYQKIKIYPNPTSEKLYFRNVDKDTKYTIYSLIGKKVLTGEITDDSFINVSNLNHGMYIIKLENSFNYKFLKK